MAKQATKRGNTRASLFTRARRAYQSGYKQGFEDSAKISDGSKFWGSLGYKRGYGDKQRIRKIEKRYKKHKNN